MPILASVLDFSVSSMIHSCYPPDMHYIGPNDVEFIHTKKTLTLHVCHTLAA